VLSFLDINENSTRVVAEFVTAQGSRNN